MNDYEEKKKAKIIRLRELADKARLESQEAHSQAHSMASVIPFGQPIHIGHHSEQWDRNYRGRIENKFRKSFELSDQADEYERRAQAAEDNQMISSDDPQAIDKLKQRIAELEALQDKMVAANKLLKNNNRDGLLELGFSEKEIEGLFTPDCFGGIGYARYALSNNRANINRLKKRLTRLENMADKETSQVVLREVKIVMNVEANRVQIFFPEKPEQKVISELHSSGFKWAHSIGAWQRHYSTYAFHLAKQIVEKYYQ